jgi:hypothetical protein
MRKTLMPALGLLMALVFVGWIAVAQSDPATATSSNSRQPYTQAPTETSIGIPAIRPTRAVAASDLSTPAFTVEDVEQYINNNPMPRNLAINSKPTIVKITFITSQQASTLLDESMDLPGDALVCYVELSGTFTFPGSNGVTVTFHKGYEVFDAHTGNLIMVGGR